MKFLFDNFDILAQAPGGIKKLRKMILQMAVQGKLTQYWRSKNTVIESQQKEILKSFKNQDEIKTGRKQFLKKVNQVIFKDKKTPNNWVKSQFFNFCLLKRGHDLPKRKRKKGHYIVASSGGINGHHNEYIVEEGVVVGRSGSTGKVHYIEGKHWPLNTVLYGEDYCRNNKKYVYLFLQVFDFTKYSSSTAVPTLNRNKFLNELIFIPPLAEQKQIVDKVDSLMALCDDLEKQQQTKTEAKLKLNKASLHELHSSITKQNFNKNWNQITKNFDLLYNTQKNVDDLKQTILQLAVQGKLAPQNPNDEPASILLEKIKKEKKRLLKEGKIKKQKPLEPIKEEEVLYKLPESWEWCKLEELGYTQTGTTPSKKYSENFGDYIPFIGPGDIVDSTIVYNNKGLSHIGLEKGRLIKANSIMMVCIGGSIGKCVINLIDVSCNQQINTITPYIDKSYRTIFHFLCSQYFKGKVSEFSGGSATPIINKQKWSNILIPFPPLAEQKRIVTKVDALLSLCEQLNRKIIDKENQNIKLINSVIDQFYSLENFIEA